MKRIFSVLFLTCITISSFSQSQSHLKFKGIPIDGTLSEFVEKLKQTGLEHVKSTEDNAMLTGDFSTYKNCMYLVLSYGSKHSVSNVSVMFPVDDTWSDLSQKYYNVKSLLIEKYGEPISSVEEFTSDYSITDNSMKMFAVSMDECNYKTVFENEQGLIQLVIRHSQEVGSFLILVYLDRQNGELLRANTLNDL